MCSRYWLSLASDCHAAADDDLAGPDRTNCAVVTQTAAAAADPDDWPGTLATQLRQLPVAFQTGV